MSNFFPTLIFATSVFLTFLSVQRATSDKSPDEHDYQLYKVSPGSDEVVLEEVNEIMNSKKNKNIGQKEENNLKPQQSNIDKLKGRIFGQDYEFDPVDEKQAAENKKIVDHFDDIVDRLGLSKISSDSDGDESQVVTPTSNNHKTTEKETVKKTKHEEVTIYNSPLTKATTTGPPSTDKLFYTKKKPYTDKPYDTQREPYQEETSYPKNKPLNNENEQYTDKPSNSKSKLFTDKPPHPKTKPYPDKPFYSKNEPYPDTPSYPKSKPYPDKPSYPESKPYPDKKYPDKPSYPESKPYPDKPSYPKSEPYPDIPSYPKSDPYPKNPSYPKSEPYPDKPSYPKNGPYPEKPSYTKNEPFNPKSEWHQPGIPENSNTILIKPDFLPSSKESNEFDFNKKVQKPKPPENINGWGNSGVKPNKQLSQPQWNAGHGNRDTQRTISIYE